MKRIKIVLILFILLIPMLVNASTFNVEKSNVNNYMSRSNYKNTYKRYIMNKDADEDKDKLKFYMDDNGVLSNKVDSKNINAGFTDGGFISRREYLLTVPEKGTSYLYDGSTIWTLTCNNESKKCFVIEYTGALDQSGIREYLNYTTSPNIRSKATEFVKKDTKVTGTGKKSDPWIFVPKYKVKIKVSDANKANIKYNGDLTPEIDNIYLSGRCTGEGCFKTVDLILNEGYKYLSNDCDGSYNETTKKFTVSNISKDIECTINVGTGKFKVTLGDKTYDLKKDIYLRHKENFYRDSGYTNILYDIKSLNDGNLPYRYGYKFLGYYISESNAKIIDKEGKVVDKVSISKDKTLLMSQWEALKVNVTFDSNGGKISRGNEKITLNFGEKYKGFPEVGKIGSSFEGWYTEATRGSKVTNETDVTNAKDHVLYAHYKVCQKGTYNDGNNAVCSTCPTGYTSIEGATAESQCFMNVLAGKYLIAKASEATNCPLGQHREENKIIYYGGTIACVNCNIGEYQDQKGQATCKTCPSGYTSVIGTKAQNKCYMSVPSGKQLIEKASEATNCPAGTYRNEDVTKYYGESASCSNCKAGTYSEEGASTCIKCVAGSYSGDGASKCIGCVGGKTNTAGSASCPTTCSNSEGVDSWKDTIWNPGNTVSDLCTAKTCSEKYKLDGKNCIIKQTVWEFAYTGDSQTFTAPYSGTYKLEVWGAQGGGCNGVKTALGGYSSGTVKLNKNQVLYVVVGGQGGKYTGGYNGGGNGAFGSGGNCGVACGSQWAHGGGGATHISTINALLSSLVNKKDSILIVAGGGGGNGGESGGGASNDCYNSPGGAGGGTTGNEGMNKGEAYYGVWGGTGGSQSSGGKSSQNGTSGFGYGASPEGNEYGGAGGGGGYYGGGASSRGHAGGGGGSGYIGGVKDGSMVTGERLGNGYAKISIIN